MGRNDDGYRFDYTYYPEIGGSIKFHFVPDTWPNASYTCEIEEQRKNTQKEVHSIFSKGDFASIDGVPLLRIPIKWLEGEPNNAVSTYSLSADVRCTNRLPYVCFLEHEKVVSKNKCGTVDNGYTFNEKTNSCYKFHSTGQSWNTAFKMCYAEGAHLVTIDSQEENDVIRQLLQAGIQYNPADSRDYGYYKNQSFIGIYNWKDMGWHSLYGNTTLPNYTPCKVFLDSLGDGDSCASVNLITSKFSNTPCNYKLPYICEKAPDSLYDAVEMAIPGELDFADGNEDCLVITQEGFYADVNCSHPYMCYKKHDRNVQKNNCGTVDPDKETCF
ncbi:uncharacterized protein LOC123695706 [Colias croceus]|uniref:uncharacterized protein LOC123695706 n=1 Tax=Colias crocea TaxID=72248 RepID=UPI001E280F3F|nr:uncharacterized protein LOC123695706 [Colias croceus]